MNKQIEKLRKKYMQHPPEGMTSKDILSMSEEAPILFYLLQNRNFL